MKRQLRYKNFYVVLISDILLLLSSLYLAFLIRFDFHPSHAFSLFHWRWSPLIVLIKVFCFFRFDLYRGMWRYTGISDLINVIKASLLSTLLILCFLLLSNRFEGFSRTIFIIDLGITILFIAGFRLFVRFYFENAAEGSLLAVLKHFYRKSMDAEASDRKRLLIIGAGNCGEKIYREIQNNATLRYQVVGFLDDHPVKVGKKIHGVPVLNTIENLTPVAEKVRADEVLIAIPSANAGQMRKIVGHCKDSGLKYRMVPNYGELINGAISVNAIRKVVYRDLLGRDVVKLDTEKIGAYLNGKSVLVTGAGGSIGSELSRQICRFKPARIVLYEWAETPLFEIELDLRRCFPDVVIVPLLADIQDMGELEAAFSANRPQVVFHSAAYKHVPMLEMQPWKAVENNVIGTFNVVECAKKYDVERFVFVSTDKAVRPANIMGASKRIAEIMVQSQNSEKESVTRFMIVRFGNVVGSSGSVVPLFKRQIQQGGPVTVTHPEVTRYFMTIHEAAQLILQVGAIGNGAEIYVLDMGTPVKIDNMARDLIRLSGFEPDKEIKIDYIGLRPGEKLFEELITEDEGIVPTGYTKIMALKGKNRDLVQLNGNVERLVLCAALQDKDQIRECIREIVPEYAP